MRGVPRYLPIPDEHLVWCFLHGDVHDDDWTDPADPCTAEDHAPLYVGTTPCRASRLPATAPIPPP